MLSIRSSKRQSLRGVAIVVVLAFVVLLTGVVLAFFSLSMAGRQLSNSSFHQTKVDELAKSALDIVVADLKQEIVNSSVASTSGNVTIYTGTNNASAVPVRNILVSSTNASLFRISGSTAIAAPGVEHPASPAISTGTSANGRTISLARWNKHYLIPRDPAKYSNANANLEGTDPVPTFTAPNWVFVTNQGPSVLVSPSSSVLGRYAYAIYDEGALLDINAAGFPSTLPAVSTHPSPDNYNLKTYGYAGKGALAFADLTALSTIPAATLTAAQIDNIIGWRNYATTRATGTFGNLIPDAARFYDAILTNTTGGLQVNNATWNNRTDQAFLSRQELINLRKTLGFPQDVLQYLGTFSRALNAPSWFPTADALNGYRYKSNAEEAVVSGTGNATRNIPNVRWIQAGTITHYDDAGNKTTYNVQPGDPLIQRRFSLAKIKWLEVTTSTGPDLSNGKDEAIKACFGLAWNASAWRWEYVANRKGPVGIMTLGELADSSTPQNTSAPAWPREPNFFELLKAGMLAGSLGRDPGPHADFSVTPVVNGVYGDFTGADGNYKTEQNLQVLQVGANIIDQADADSYPTAIHLNVYGMTKADDLAIQTVYGIENLPYLLNLGTLALADPKVTLDSSGVPTSNGTLKVWIQPELWNPHQIPANAPTARPSQFRAYAYGSIYPQWYRLKGNPDKTIKGPTIQYDDGSGVGDDIPSGSIYFMDTGDATSPFYVNPALLTVDLQTTTGTSVVDLTNTPAANCNINNQYPGYINDKTGLVEAGQNQFAAFSVGKIENYCPKSDDKTTATNKYALPNPLAYFSLQYKGPDGNYHPYNFVARFYADAGIVIAANVDNWHGGGRTINGCTSWQAGFGAIRVDPRTDRFALSSGWLDTNHLVKNSTMCPNTGDMLLAAESGASCLPQPSSVFAFSGSKPYLNALWAVNVAGYTASAVGSVTGGAYYCDQDGTVRPGDCYRQSRATGNGCQLYHGNVTGLGSLTPFPGTGSAEARRPVILNRPFRSVAELGFAYRDQPFKSLDFWSADSADGALLDLFSTADLPPVCAGQINPNNASAAVLQAVIAGGAKSDALGVFMAKTDANTLAAIIKADITASGPYRNRSDLATRFGPKISGTGSGVAFDTTQSANANWANKAYAEAPVRALADVTNTRTWNLMIDIIAQTGSFPAKSPATADALNSSFVVQGERRYWLHVAIDRFTGKIIDEQLEPVYE